MRRTLTPSTTFLITWRYTDAMSIGPDVPTPRTENTTCAVGSEGRESVAREPPVVHVYAYDGFSFLMGGKKAHFTVCLPM